MAKEGVQDPQPIEAIPHELSKLRLDDRQLFLLMGRTPRPTFPLLRPPSGKHREWFLHRVLDIEPLAMPSPIGVTRRVREVGDQWLRPLLQGERTDQSDSRRFPLGQGPLAEDPPEEVHVRLHPEEGLVDGHEVGDVQHPSQIEVQQLQAPLIEELAQELMRGIS